MLLAIENDNDNEKDNVNDNDNHMATSIKNI